MKRMLVGVAILIYDAWSIANYLRDFNQWVSDGRPPEVDFTGTIWQIAIVSVVGLGLTIWGAATRH